MIHQGVVSVSEWIKTVSQTDKEINFLKRKTLQQSLSDYLN